MYGKTFKSIEEHAVGRRPLPPFGRLYREQPPSNGVWIACGPNAWDFTKLKPFPVLVLPDECDPADFQWPVADQDVLLIEIGTYDTERVERIAQVLLESGARLVYPIRTANFRETRAFWRSEEDAAA